MSDKDLIHDFKEKVHRFKEWMETESDRYGEWETDYPFWDDIYSSVNQLVEQIPIKDSKLIEDFLFILARDNEAEHIIDLVIDHPSLLITLATYGLDYKDHEARWQLAYGLGELKDRNNEAKVLLRQYIHDKHEYVRSRARFAIETLEDRT
ncbi:hypothetical protein [Kroppenstedtia sanguinis]|uniref:HEAT repeat domain-containing protein n=1 Tax=Kroppenstedtia sanguinis TaxID=1380684 RepID=A0ABW4CB49_9BACL